MQHRTQGTGAGRDAYVDFLRTGSLFVVVVWHWVFTVVVWRADGPHVGNPLGTTRGLWALTWLLQVVPVFFFVGGFAHLRTWESVERAGGGYRTFVARRLRRLLVPAAVCLGAAAVLRLVTAVAAPEVPWATRGIVLMVSPLWFLGIYVGLALIAPVAVRVHRRLGAVALVLLAGGAAAVDVLRFGVGLEGAGLANMLFVWVLVHQLGFFWPRLTAAGRKAAWCLALAGFVSLVVLTGLGPYPRSMVGVPGEGISNMGPPTVCIVALTLLQAGVVLLLRARVTAWLARPRPRRLVSWAGSRAMTVYVWHFPAFAAAYGILRVAGVHVPEATTPAWWAQRPLWALVPALCTIPLVAVFRRFETRDGRPGEGPGRGSPGRGASRGPAAASLLR